MDNKLERKYGLFTAICMVVGIVIGSGVFFKAQTILQKTEGNMPLGILAWIIGGLIMIACILVCLLIILVLAFTAAVYLIVAAVLGTFGTFLPSAILLAVTLLFACIFLFAVTFLGTKYFCKGISGYIKWNKTIWYKGVGV